MYSHLARIFIGMCQGSSVNMFHILCEGQLRSPIELLTSNLDGYSTRLIKYIDKVECDQLLSVCLFPVLSCVLSCVCFCLFACPARLLACSCLGSLACFFLACFFLACSNACFPCANVCLPCAIGVFVDVYSVFCIAVSLRSGLLVQY